MSTRYPVKAPGETVTVQFDFSKEAAAVTSPAVACSTHWSATDDTTDVRSGPPQVSSDNAAIVLQKVTGGEDMTDYALVCTANGQNGDVLQVAAILPVRGQPA